jgi:hypothetical protein
MKTHLALMSLADLTAGTSNQEVPTQQQLVAGISEGQRRRGAWNAALLQ